MVFVQLKALKFHENHKSCDMFKTLKRKRQKRKLLHLKYHLNSLPHQYTKKLNSVNIYEQYYNSEIQQNKN